MSSYSPNPFATQPINRSPSIYDRAMSQGQKDTGVQSLSDFYGAPGSAVGTREVGQSAFNPHIKTKKGVDLGNVKDLGSLLGKTGLGKKAIGKLGGASLSKLGFMGKMGSNPTPYGLAGAGAQVLGSLIATKKKKTGGAIGGAGSGAATGAMIGSVIPGIGTAAGAVIGGLFGGVKGWFSGKKKLKEEKAANQAAALEGGPAGKAGKAGSLTGAGMYNMNSRPSDYMSAPPTYGYGNVPTPPPGTTYGGMRTG
jgi:hypothetical protein